MRFLFHQDISPSSLDDFRTFLAEHGAENNIDLSIDSDGGDVLAAFAIVDLIRELRRNQKTITAYIQSRARSAATLISSACDKVIAKPYSTFLIHPPKSCLIGCISSKDAQSMASELDAITESIAAIYSNKSGKPKEYFFPLIQDEISVTAAVAKGWGLIDEIEDDLATVITDKAIDCECHKSKSNVSDTHMNPDLINSLKEELLSAIRAELKAAAMVNKAQAQRSAFVACLAKLNYDATQTDSLIGQFDAADAETKIDLLLNILNSVKASTERKASIETATPQPTEDLDYRSLLKNDANTLRNIAETNPSLYSKLEQKLVNDERLQNARKYRATIAQLKQPNPILKFNN
jgi:ATP-dependent protease ClpP protease subunit